jgi:Protein of unknown function (DUF4238)
MSPNPQASHKHHFIPAFYTSRWAVNEGRLIEWSKPYREIKFQPKHPNATGFEYELYSFNDLPPELRQWFEDEFLAETDDRASKALQEILAGRLDGLNLKLRSGWSRFLYTLLFRHPDPLLEMREAIERIWGARRALPQAEYETIRKPGDPLTSEEYLANISAEMHARAHVNLLQGALDNPKLGVRINNMRWCVYDLSRWGRLLTSDWPVELSLGVTRPTITVPLSPTRLFVATDDLAALREIQRSDPYKVISKVNRYVVSHARRYVFSEDTSQERFIRNRMSSKKINPPFFPELATRTIKQVNDASGTRIFQELRQQATQPSPDASP